MIGAKKINTNQTGLIIQFGQHSSCDCFKKKYFSCAASLPESLPKPCALASQLAGDRSIYPSSQAAGPATVSWPPPFGTRDHVDGQPAAPGRRRRRAHRSGRGCRAPHLGRGRQPRAAGPGHSVRPLLSSSLAASLC